LIVESTPAGAEVLLDGRPIGTTPLTYSAPGPGPLAGRLTLRLAGHEEHSERLTIEAGQERRLTGLVLRQLAPAEPTRPPPPAPATGPAEDQTGRPEWWPSYLAGYQLPAGRSWSDYRMRKVDGMVQVRIPAGEFDMGDPELRSMQQHVTVGAFWIDLTEVTLEQVYRFFDAQKLEMPLQIRPEQRKSMPHHPMFYVDYDRAAAYAAWAGRRLPTPAEWEWAARAGAAGLRYGWGPEWDPKRANGNRQSKTTMPVGSYAPNAFGLLDMVGNVAEWCAAVDGALPEIRGGGYLSEPTSLQVHAAQQRPPGTANTFIGFRCVED